MPNTISAGLAATLASETKTLAVCIKVKRLDGTVLGFTNHDNALFFDLGDGDGFISYSPKTAALPSATESDTSVSTNTSQIQSIIDSEAITELDIRSGLYDGAEVILFRVDYTNLSDGALESWIGSIGEVTLDDTMYTAELESLSAAYENEIIEIIQPTCRADLGDTRCKVRLTVVGWAAASAYTASSDFDAAIGSEVRPTALDTPVPGDANWPSTIFMSNWDGANLDTTLNDERRNIAITFSGAAALSTTEFKSGTTSLFLPTAAADYCYIPYDPRHRIGSQDFTIESWIWFTDVGIGDKGSCVMSMYQNVGDQRSFGYYHNREGGAMTMRFLYSNNGVATVALDSATFTPTVSTWYHVAVVRAGNTLRHYIDGVQSGTDLDVSGMDIFPSSERLEIGNLNSSTGSKRQHHGYLDATRLTIGAAQYTADFTPPADVLPTSTTTKVVNPFWFRAIVGGTTHATTEPVWPTTLGGTVVDGTVTWEAINARTFTTTVTGINRETLVALGVEISKNYLTEGEILFLDGVHVNRKVNIYEDSGTGELKVIPALPADVADGTSVKITLPCVKSTAACKFFKNIYNMRAEQFGPDDNITTFGFSNSNA